MSQRQRYPSVTREVLPWSAPRAGRRHRRQAAWEGLEGRALLSALAAGHPPGGTGHADVSPGHAGDNGNGRASAPGQQGDNGSGRISAPGQQGGSAVDSGNGRASAPGQQGGNAGDNGNGRASAPGQQGDNAVDSGSGRASAPGQQDKARVVGADPGSGDPGSPAQGPQVGGPKDTPGPQGGPSSLSSGGESAPPGNAGQGGPGARGNGPKADPPGNPGGSPDSQGAGKTALETENGLSAPVVVAPRDPSGPAQGRAATSEADASGEAGPPAPQGRGASASTSTSSPSSSPRQGTPSHAIGDTPQEGESSAATSILSSVVGVPAAAVSSAVSALVTSVVAAVTPASVATVTPPGTDHGDPQNGSAETSPAGVDAIFETDGGPGFEEIIAPAGPGAETAGAVMAAPALPAQAPPGASVGFSSPGAPGRKDRGGMARPNQGEPEADDEAEPTVEGPAVQLVAPADIAAAGGETRAGDPLLSQTLPGAPAVDASLLDRAIQDFLTELRDLDGAVSHAIGANALPFWLAGAGLAAGAAVYARRRARRSAPGPARLAAGWVPDVPTVAF